MRYRLRTLLILLAITGLGCAALRTPTVLWGFVVFLSLMLALLTSGLVAFHHRGATRAFAMGFLLFGACFLALTLIPSNNLFSVGARAIAELFYPTIHGPISDEISFKSSRRFSEIVETLSVLLLGWLGGIIGTFVSSTAKSEK
jgi:FtsH-binding integral membrane protein